MKTTATDTVQEAIIKMSEGNPGALRVLFDLSQRPDDGALLMLKLDQEGIYGSNIWLAYKDVSGSDLERLAETLVENPISLKNAVGLAADGML